MASGSNAQSRPLLNLVVAHKLEAQVLLQHLKMQAVRNHAYPVYQNTDGISLIVTGNGRLAAAAATAYLAGLQGDACAPAWLNIGIAGHGSATVGTALLVNRINEVATGQVYYPTPRSSGFANAALCTVDAIETEYGEAVAYDMEAAGYWPVASRCGCLDLVQCIKIVSDNPEQGVEQFRESSVKGLMAERLEEMAQFIAALRAASVEYLERSNLPACYEELLASYRFSSTQRQQLVRLLQRWQVTGDAEQLQDCLAARHGDARAVLSALDAGLLAKETG